MRAGQAKRPANFPANGTASPAAGIPASVAVNPEFRVGLALLLHILLDSKKTPHGEMGSILYF